MHHNVDLKTKINNPNSHLSRPFYAVLSQSRSNNCLFISQMTEFVGYERSIGKVMAQRYFIEFTLTSA